MKHFRSCLVFVVLVDVPFESGRGVRDENTHSLCRTRALE